MNFVALGLCNLCNIILIIGKSITATQESEAVKMVEQKHLLTKDELIPFSVFEASHKEHSMNYPTGTDYPDY